MIALSTQPAYTYSDKAVSVDYSTVLHMRKDHAVGSMPMSQMQDTRKSKSAVYLLEAKQVSYHTRTMLKACKSNNETGKNPAQIGCVRNNARHF